MEKGPLRVGVLGAAGRMGQSVCSAIMEAESMELAITVDLVPEEKVIGGIQHKMEKDKIIKAKEIEAAKTVSVEQIRQQEHSIKDEILTLLISATASSKSS